MEATAGVIEREGETEEEAFVLPRAPLPEIIVSNVPGSWAYDTMVNERLILPCSLCLCVGQSM